MKLSSSFSERSNARFSRAYSLGSWGRGCAGGTICGAGCAASGFGAAFVFVGIYGVAPFVIGSDSTVSTVSVLPIEFRLSIGVLLIYNREHADVGQAVSEFRNPARTPEPARRLSLQA